MLSRGLNPIYQIGMRTPKLTSPSPQPNRPAPSWPCALDHALVSASEGKMEHTPLLVLLLCVFSSPSESQPQQVHLSYGYAPSQMVVMWSTASESSSIVFYGVSPHTLSLKEAGACWEFTKGNPDGLHYLHKVTLQVSA